MLCYNKEFAVNNSHLAKMGAKNVASTALYDGTSFGNIDWSQQIENLH